MAEQRESVWENRIGTVLQIIVASSLLWIGNSVVDLRTELSVMKMQVTGLTAQVPQVLTLTQNFKELEYTNRELARRLERVEAARGISSK
jgi:hypothetical protein